MGINEIINLPKSNIGYMVIDGKARFVQIVSIKTEYIKEQDAKRLIIDMKREGESTTSYYDSFPNIYATENDVRLNHPMPVNENCEIRTPVGVFYYFDEESIEVKSIQRTHVTQVIMWNNEYKYWYVSHYQMYPQSCNDIELFKSEEECRGCYDFEVVDEDGSTHTNRSIRSKVLLTPEQMEILSEIDCIFETAKKANIKFFIRQNELYALNKSEIKSFQSSYSYDDLCEPEKCDPCPLNNFMHQLECKIHNLSWEDIAFAEINT